MASPAKAAVEPPKTLPPDFFDKQSGTPDTLPGNFDFGDKSTSEPADRNRVQKAFDTLTTVTPQQEQGHSAPVNALQKVGAGVMQLATPLFHPEQALEHASDALIHPRDTAGEMMQGIKEHPWETAGQAIGGGILGGIAGEVAPKVMAKIPTRAKAGAMFEDLNTKLANAPVRLNATAQPLQRVTEIGERGGTLPTPVSKFLQRSQSPIDMTYPEARDYQSNLSSLSREDAGRMTGPMRGGVKQLNRAYFQDIQNAAGPYGEDYANAMKMNRRANQIRNVVKNVGKVAIPAAIGTSAYKLTKAME